MIFLFRQKSPGNIILLLLFGLLLKMPVFIYPRQITATQNDEDLYHWLIGQLTGISPNNALLCSVVAFLLLYSQALMINHIMNEFRLVGKQTYLPGMAYLLITSLLPEWNYLSSPLLVSSLILWGFLKLFKLYNLQNATSTIFNIGLLTGVASYIYFPAASFLLCYVIGIMILKPFRINEMILFLMGCFTLYYFNAAYLFLTDNLSFATFLPHVSVQVPVVKNSLWLAVSIMLLAIPFLLGGFFVQKHLHKMLIQVRKNWSIFLLYLLLAFFIPFVNSYATFNNWILIVAPFACFHTAAYHYPTKIWLPNILFFASVGFILYLQYATPLWQ